AIIYFQFIISILVPPSVGINKAVSPPVIKNGWGYESQTKIFNNLYFFFMDITQIIVTRPGITCKGFIRGIGHHFFHLGPGKIEMLIKAGDEKCIPLSIKLNGFDDTFMRTKFFYKFSIFIKKIDRVSVGVPYNKIRIRDDQFAYTTKKTFFGSLQWNIFYFLKHF